MWVATSSNYVDTCLCYLFLNLFYISFINGLISSFFPCHRNIWIIYQNLTILKQHLHIHLQLGPTCCLTNCVLPASCLSYKGCAPSQKIENILDHRQGWCWFLLLIVGWICWCIFQSQRNSSHSLQQYIEVYWFYSFCTSHHWSYRPPTDWAIHTL